MLKALLIASRPKTLALALAGPIVAAAMASILFEWDKSIFLWQILTTIFLQVLSNYANDYGDFEKGTDQLANRNDRALTAGLISQTAMKKAVLITAALAFISGIALLNQSFPSIGIYFALFLILGITAIAGAIKYTMGASAYGYRALGDVVVFLFFGPVAIIGGFYLHTHEIGLDILLISVAFGLFSVAVLNINNIRDIQSDRISNKKTLANQWGKEKAISYQRALLLTAWLLNVYVLVLRQLDLWGDSKPLFKDMALLPIVFMPFLMAFLFHCNKLKTMEERSDYNKQLRNIALLTLSFALTWVAISILLF